MEIMLLNWEGFKVDPPSAALWNFVTTELMAFSRSDNWKRKTREASDVRINHLRILCRTAFVWEEPRIKNEKNLKIWWFGKAVCY